MIDRIALIIMKLFNHTWKIQQKVLDLNSSEYFIAGLLKCKRVMQIVFFCYFIFIGILLSLKIFFEIEIWIIALFLLANGIIFILENAKSILVSLRIFFKFCFYIDIVISLTVSSILHYYFNASNLETIIFLVVFGVCWIYFSILANSKVAITANTIIGGFFTILTIIANTIILYFPPNFGIPPEIMNKIDNSGYTIQQGLQFTVNIATLPFIIINGLALIFCFLKSYWTEKYNSNNEIK